MVINRVIDAAAVAAASLARGPVRAAREQAMRHPACPGAPARAGREVGDVALDPGQGPPGPPGAALRAASWLPGTVPSERPGRVRSSILRTFSEVHRPRLKIYAESMQIMLND